MQIPKRSSYSGLLLKNESVHAHPKNEDIRLLRISSQNSMNNASGD